MKTETRRDIVVLGTTYPAYSRKYTELTCTGGILTDTYEMVRLHPIPGRYMEDDKRLKSFQRLSAILAKNTSDPRPESMRVVGDSIEIAEVIPSTQPEERVRYLESSPHLVASVEELKKRQRLEGTSLGIVKPKEIVDYRLEPKTSQERREWNEKEAEVLAQRPLFGEVKPIAFPDTRFIVSWRCDDPACLQPHEMSLLQWGLHELNRKYSDDPNREAKVLEAMRLQLTHNERDIYLFLGSYRGVQYNFGLMDSYSPPRQRQTALF